MVKVVRVLFALVTALWYFTSPTGSTTVPHNSPKMKSLELSYYKPLEYNVVKYTSAVVPETILPFAMFISFRFISHLH